VTTQIDDRIMTRLAKLLEMAERGDEHEAQVAAERAAELMAKHEIEMADVQIRTGQPNKPQVEKGRVDALWENADGWPRTENWHKGLLSALASVMGGKAWIHGKGKQYQFWMIGTRDAINAVRYMYALLERQVNRLSREAQRRHVEPSNAWRRSYSMGMVAKILERLEAGKKMARDAASSTALVVVDATALAVKEQFDQMKMRTTKVGARKRPDAGSVGYRDGDRVDLGNRDAGRLGEGQKKLG
jgi:hypothetical protein